MTDEEFKAQQRTVEEIKLLISELCQRMPYGIKLQKCGEQDTIYQLYSINMENHEILYWAYRGKALSIGECGKIHRYRIPKYKPYLYPLSSMTEEQCEEFRMVSGLDADLESIRRGEFSLIGDIAIDCIVDAIEWFNKNHFDYRELIPLGLAIDATGLGIYE